jgi:AmmeMemoRadiSam system protein B
MQPKLRPLDIRPIQHRGQPALLMRDPLVLTDQTIVLPQQLAPLLSLLDGTRDEAALRAALEIRYGVRLPLGALPSLLSQLDDALLLENERSAEALAEALRIYRDGPHRLPALAGQGYPADTDQLQQMLQGYIDSASPSQPDSDSDNAIRGLVSPHIDYNRGHTVYAQVWQAAAEAVQEAELAVIVGTDHMAEDGAVTLTQQSYATPWGTLPTSQLVVQMVAQAIGEDQAFKHELHHRTEHSVELAAIWLHFIRGGKEIPLVPILLGSLGSLYRGNGDPDDALRFTRAAEALRKAAGPYRTLIIVAGDLAHVGPAFGDSAPVDILSRARLRASDRELMDVICSGDPEALLERLKQQGDPHRVCGLPPIYLALRVLGETQGAVTGYAQCPADSRGASLVSICGIVLR